MAMARIDRRVARTRALLQQAHLALVVEKGFERVTVEDICAAANVGRSTFYAHYPNKEALHRDGLDGLRRRLMAHQVHVAPESPGAAFGFSLPMFEHAKDHLALYRALSNGRAGAAVMDEIRGLIGDLVRAQLPPVSASGLPKAHQEAVVRYLAGAFVSMLTWWLDGGAAVPAQEMDALFRTLAFHGLAPGVKAVPVLVGDA
jgi:AcrR family transcriptional regulator